MESPFSGKRVLVTGGLGFIGSNVARALVDRGAHVTILDSMIPGCGGNPFNIQDIRDKVEVIQADLRQSEVTGHAVGGKEYIFNLAGQISHIDSMNDPQTDMELNVRSHLSLLEACRLRNRSAKIVYASTRQVYGRLQYLPADELHPLNPTDINGVDKLAAERYHGIYDKVHGIRSCSLRLTNTYGPGQLMKHNRQGFIGWFIRQIVLGEEISIYGDGTQVRDFNYVDDVVDAMLLVAERPEANGEVFNLGGSQAIRLLDLVDLMMRVAGKGSYKVVPFPEGSKKIDIGNATSDYSKIAKTLGWKPKTSLEVGLERTFAYYSKVIDQYLP